MLGHHDGCMELDSAAVVMEAVFENQISGLGGNASKVSLRKVTNRA